MPAMHHRRCFLHVLWGGLCALAASVAIAAEPAAAFDLELDVIRRGYDGKTCMTQARAGIIPRDGGPPIVVTTMSPLWLAGSDVYRTVHEMRSEDGGRTWDGPRPVPTLGRRPDGTLDGKPAEIGVCDLWPKWHAKTGKLLAIGHTVRYVDDTGPAKGDGPGTCYTVYDAEARTWSPWKLLLEPSGGEPFAGGAGCVQRLDLPDGEILLPVYGFDPSGEPRFPHVQVLRLGFDGETLTILGRGNQVRQDTKRGLTEPSLTRFRNTYYLTIRHDDTGYVCTSADGLHFSRPEPWCWEDNTNLGNYNTQTHWVTHDDGLFLVYTRRGANNDHVFRNRAPLFIAAVDPNRVRVIRATERAAVPERGARLGNFGVTEVSAAETWIVTCEWMQTWKQASIIIPVDNAAGADNSTYAARVLWKKPNTGWSSR